VTSQRSAEANLPYMNTLNMRSMRPRSIRMLPAPKGTLNTVIASAARASGVRHPAPTSLRIAEMNVPECARPMKKTKLTMYTPQ
jgi:hypothetical protein